MPAAPAPLAAWYVETMAFLSPKSRCSGHSAMAAMAVVQLGLATRRASPIAPALISGMTSGTASS